MVQAMIASAHDASGFPLADTSGTGNPPHQGDGRAQGRAFQDGGGPTFRGYPPSHSWLGQPQAGGRSFWAARPAAGASCGRAAQAQTGANRLPTYHRPLPGSVEAAVLSVDAGSGGAFDRPALWGASFGLDGRTAAGQVGLHAAKARAPGLRARLPRGPLLAATPVSGYSRPGPPGEGVDFLGGRNGLARGPRRRTFLQSARPNASDFGHRPTVPLQSHFGPHQPRAVAVHGVQGAFYGGRVLEIPAPTLASEPAQNLPDHRQPSGASGPGHAPLVQDPSSTTARLFPARLQSRAQPRRIPQSGCQDQRGRSNPSSGPKGNDRQCPGLPPFDPNPPLAGQTLLSSRACSLRLCVKYFTLPVIYGFGS